MNNSTVNEYTCVLRLNGMWFTALHIQEGKKTFISDHPNRDLEIAFIAAQKFAVLHNIPCDQIVKDLDRPLLSVYKSASGWHPIAIDSNNIISYKPVAEKLSLDQVISLGHEIAEMSHLDFIPSIGISMVEAQGLQTEKKITVKNANKWNGLHKVISFFSCFSKTASQIKRGNS